MWLHSLNRCDQPPWEIASLAFNEAAPAVRLQGVRQANPLLFDRLAQLADPGARVRQLHDYMDVRFQLHQWQAQGSRVTLTFDPATHPAPVMVERVCAASPVRDLTIENLPIEEIVARMYREEAL